jgi:hypothetical protein
MAPVDAAPSSAEIPGVGVPIDGGIAWCTAPAPDELRSSVDLSPQTSLKIYAGRCVPPNGYYRACDDAGMPIYVPPCGDEFQGTRLELTTQGHAPITFRAHALDIEKGPLPDGSWPLGISERALIVKAQMKVGDALHEDERVIAIAAKEDDWQIPAESFSDVEVDVKGGTFAFWRNAFCIDPIGCTTARWESTRGGVRLLTTSDKDAYYQARVRTRGQMPTYRAQTPACPLPALLGAARVYTYARLYGDTEKVALAEFDHLVAGLSTSRCAKMQAGTVKPIGVIRAEMVKAVKELLAGGGKWTKR